MVDSGVLSAEHVENVLARLNAVPAPPSVETQLQLNEVPLADTGRYDRFRAASAQQSTEIHHA